MLLGIVGLATTFVARLAFIRQTSMTGEVPAILPLTLDPGASVHAWLAVFTACVTFWTARTLLSRGGIRTVVTGLAWVAVAFRDQSGR